MISLCLRRSFNSYRGRKFESQIKRLLENPGSVCTFSGTALGVRTVLDSNQGGGVNIQHMGHSEGLVCYVHYHVTTTKRQGFLASSSSR